MTNPLVSVCIPVYNTEPFLYRCLESVAAQEFDGVQVVVVNDGSTGSRDKKLTCKKIVKQFKKEHKFGKNQVLYREHRTNLGLLEARRTGVEAAEADYVFMLDSDDSLLPGALTALYKAAIDSGADIVQGQAKVVCAGDNASSVEEKVLLRQKEMQQVVNKIYEGELTGSQIFDGYILQQNHTGFLWGKLYKRELYLQALSHIPFTRCVFSEDYLQYFFISYEAKKYVGLAQPVYEYSINTGISSFNTINDLKKWEQICSSANVFTILFTAVKELPSQRITPAHLKSIGLKSRFVLSNVITQMKAEVTPSLLPAARELLCRYWGEDFVNEEEKKINP